MVATHTERGLVVVTGASSGIGAATALVLADRGYRVIAAARRVDRLAELAASHPAITAHALDANFGIPIRSYVLHPYQQVKDLRSGVEIGNVDGVLDGDLDMLMEGYLRWERETGRAG